MAKKVIGEIKLQIPAGQANPAPPVGPALGQHGVNIMEFCKAFNANTQDQAGLIIPVVISVYQYRSFTFITKSPPAASLLKRAAGRSPPRSLRTVLVGGTALDPGLALRAREARRSFSRRR